ncbi:hypothetical protein ILUMI_11726 [Ignelater luminosus]|uniref:DUF4817 domain-containing protein n=1 Tax=Ignelater luminosus TaxID=2038154 RepID=A0A8K0CZS7_IGNLU|nr:hypothetical protein ILUMI_11726 [Ignelater luminosus]
MRWNSEERAFAVEAYFSSGCSVIATQRAFRNRFNLAPLAPVPDCKSIVTWVTTFRQTASATKRRTGVPRPVRSPENIEAVRASMLRSPRRSARKHASALRLSDRSVRRILRDDLHFHPYKMAIALGHTLSSPPRTCELFPSYANISPGDYTECLKQPPTHMVNEQNSPETVAVAKNEVSQEKYVVCNTFIRNF